MSSKSTLIAPSILSADFLKLEEELKAIDKSGSDYIHCDIMDGVFVPNISFGPMIVDFVNKAVTKPLDVHLMIVEPEKYVEKFVKAGADIVTVHANACKDLSSTIDLIHSFGVKAGVSVNPDISIDTFLPLIEKIDLVLIMSVFAGFGGQKFIPETMNKVKAVREKIDELGLKTEIEVDGGINDKTAKIAVEHGADVLVAGSYVFNGSDYKQKIDSLR